MFSYQEKIRPSADLRNHYNEISKQCREDREVVIITVNGRGDTVSLGYEEYKRMKARIELLEILAEADEDAVGHGAAPDLRIGKRLEPELVQIGLHVQKQTAAGHEIHLQDVVAQRLDGRNVFPVHVRFPLSRNEKIHCTRPLYSGSARKPFTGG